MDHYYRPSQWTNIDQKENRMSIACHTNCVSAHHSCLEWVRSVLLVIACYHFQFYWTNIDQNENEPFSPSHIIQMITQASFMYRMRIEQIIDHYIQLLSISLDKYWSKMKMDHLVHHIIYKLYFWALVICRMITEYIVGCESQLLSISLGKYWSKENGSFSPFCIILIVFPRMINV